MARWESNSVPFFLAACQLYPVSAAGRFSAALLNPFQAAFRSVPAAYSDASAGHYCGT